MPRIDRDTLKRLKEEKLLDVRIRDLPLSIEGTWVEGCTQQLLAELKEKGITFSPPFYVTDEWLSPDKEPIIGIPFYLMHPALIRLENKMMLEAEGSTKSWCMKLLRHETGHTINYAYKLYGRKKWQKMFGRFSEEYGDTYRFRPYSRNYVRHLEDYYAQYHPDEDFAETFAVWLTPKLNWEKQYKGWKALEKLWYVDSLMNEIKGREPLVKRPKKYWEASKRKSTLRNHYKRKRIFNAEDFPDFHDANLMKIFDANREDSRGTQKACDVLRKHKKAIIESVYNWAGERKFMTNIIISQLIERCGSLGLVLRGSETDTVLRISTYITVLVMNYLHTGRFKGGK